MRRFLALSIVLVACLSGGEALGACSLGQLAQLPVTMVGLRPTITAQINGQNAVFVVDSGSFFSMLSPAAASELHLRLDRPPDRLKISGIGGPMQYSVANVDHFGLGPFQLRHVDFVVGGNQFGGNAQGVIGENLLQAGDVDYDLANGALRLFHPKGCEKVDLVYWDRDKPYSRMDLQAISALESQPRGTAYVNGHRIRVTFDTGSPVSLLSLTAAERAGVKPGDPGVEPNGYTHGIGRDAVRSWIAPFESFKIGDEEIRNTRLRIADLNGLDTDMLIGADFFLAHHVYVATSQRRLYFTYNGGPVFNLTAYAPLRHIVAAAPVATPPANPPVATDTTPPPAAAAATSTPSSAAGAAQSASSSSASATSAEPTDAAGFARRGAAFAGRGDYQQAIADLTRASQLDPSQASYFEQRGLAEMRLREPTQAMADFDQAIKLKQDDVTALFARSQLRFASRDRDGGLADLHAIDQAVPKQADIRIGLANTYQRVGAFQAAIGQYTLWLDAHPTDFGAAAALNGRCRTRALTGEDLRQALGDCNSALRASATDPLRSAVLDSRGLVRLRLGDYKHSVDDYDKALAIRPNVAWSLYGRGIDEVREGRASVGQSDMRAAGALQPNIAALFSRIGISP
jgi:tetratricopeptide (TPR) repeat protein/predicted aspartyl protease